MDIRVWALAEAFLVTPIHVVLYLPGGSCQALGWMLSVPSASNTILENLISYSHARWRATPDRWELRREERNM
ncbi:hypothetical protein QJS04_geneDACA024649 [Acorus gramineus]|uniref:Uncharacterized protein n=1 Tax=Acorus gramineus TaxID=55184 RepID=A0AAV9AMZ9_ACOGR|nr:hypothetical protein QJS04_geneDACA024649 [Acorus gramineus]